MHRGEPEPRAAALLLGGEERLEDAVAHAARDARAGVGDPQHGVVVFEAGRDADRPGEGVLEGVRDEVEDDLLPHLPVDVEGRVERRAVDLQAQARLLDRGAEHAGELGRERAEVGLLVGGLHTPGLDAREVEQRVDQLQEALAVPVDDLEQRVGLGGL